MHDEYVWVHVYMRVGMFMIEWVCVWEFQQLWPCDPFYCFSADQRRKGADEGRCGGSQGTMRLESKAAASTNRGKEIGWIEGLKRIKAWEWRGASLTACYN